VDVESLVSAVSAGAGAAVVVGSAMRRYWRGRETRQQAQFEASVQRIVDKSVAGIISRQTQFEQRQGAHLDRQDKVIDEIRKAVRITGGRRGTGR
jgi:hypothetical protein